MSASIFSTVLEQCLRGEPWSRELLSHLEEPELFSILAEGLSDRFEPELTDCYAGIFSEVIAAARRDLNAAELRARYERVRRPRRFAGPDPQAIVVLSRITLGADIAVTSVLMDALKRRFPEAPVLFAGPRKSYELFAADPRICHLAVVYGGMLEERLRAPWFGDAGTLVVDPDSRITQLGLLPVCPEERYYLFESRAYGADGNEPLPVLARRWAEEVFGVGRARPYIAPAANAAVRNGIAVSFGVGENPGKRIGGAFEAELLAYLAGTGLPVVVDSGGSEAEAERVREAVQASGAPAQVLRGAFAAFAATIAASRCYVGYDSGGQHVAAACGVPLVSVFAGYPSERFVKRWRPSGTGRVEVVRGDEENVLQRACEAVGRVLE